MRLIIDTGTFSYLVRLTDMENAFFSFFPFRKCKTLPGVAARIRRQKDDPDNLSVAQRFSRFLKMSSSPSDVIKRRIAPHATRGFEPTMPATLIATRLCQFFFVVFLLLFL